MDIPNLIIFLTIGGVTGWLAGKYMKLQALSGPESILIGLAGGILGGYLFRLLVFAAGGFFGSMVTASAGAVTLIYIIQLYKRPKET